MGDWEIDTDEVLVKSRDEFAGVLRDKKTGRRIVFGSSQLVSRDTRIDLRNQSHGMEDQKDPTVACFIAAADLLNNALKNHNSVVIHCKNGNSRTGHALIAFLVRHAGMDIKKAAELVTQAQHKRGMRAFNVEHNGHNNYFDWMVAEEAKIKNTSNSGDVLAMYATANPEEGGNKIFHTVVDNKSAPERPPIGEFEITWLTKNAAVYQGYTK